MAARTKDPSIIDAAKNVVTDARDVFRVFARTLYYLFRGKREKGEVARQMFAIGNESLFFMCITMAFIGAIITFQTGLQSQGVRCWVFSEDTRGSALVERHSTSDQEEVERWVRYYRKMIVVGSTAGLDTEAVLNDITQAKERQQSTDRWVLFLVSPDDGLGKPASRSARNLVAEHVVFDLRGYRDDRQAYAAEIERLAEALKQDQPASAGVPAHDGQL